RTGRETQETMIVLITRTKQLPHAKALVKELTNTYPQIKSIMHNVNEKPKMTFVRLSIMHNVNEKRTNVIFGPKTNVLWGEPYIYDSIGELRFAISARSFYQVNPPQTKKLYEKALQYANIDHNDIVINAYCGIGTISLFLAQQAKKVYGIEVVPEAVNDAKKNAKRNNVTNAEFFVGKAEKVMPWWKAQGIQPNVIVVDPPRKGC